MLCTYIIKSIKNSGVVRMPAAIKAALNSNTPKKGTAKATSPL